MNIAVYVLAFTAAILLLAVLFSNEKDYVKYLTDQFLDAIVANNAELASRLFCSYGIIITDTSDYSKTHLLEFLDKVGNLPNLRIHSKAYAISEVDDGIHMNKATVTWIWDGLEVPVHSTMIFSISKSCILQLEFLGLPELR